MPRDLLARAPELDDETALSRLQRSLREAREALDMSPREIAIWLVENDFDRAGEVVDEYLDAPTRSLQDLGGELRKLLDKELDGRWYSYKALGSSGTPNLREGSVFEDSGRHYVLARQPDHPTRRVYVDPPSASGAPYTIVEGDLRARDFVWEVDRGDGDDIEALWSRYHKLLRSLELVPAYLGEAHQLLEIATEAIESPKCLGAQRQRAIKALRTAEKYYRRAANRIHRGRPAGVLEALVQMVQHITTSAVTIAEACGVGQLDFLSGPIAIRESDRRALAHAGEDIVDVGDTAEAVAAGSAGSAGSTTGLASASGSEVQPDGDHGADPELETDDEPTGETTDPERTDLESAAE